MPGITRLSLFWCAFLPVIILLRPSAQPVYAASITVDRSCLLADAITAANSDTSKGGCPAGNGVDTITLTLDVILSGDLPAITSAITIEGGMYAINGINRHRIFFVESSGDLRLNELKMMRGSAENESSICFVESDGREYRDRGGAICNDGGAVTISNCHLIANRAEYGGAIYSFGGDITITNSILESNYSGSRGGSIYNFAGSVNINDSILESNHSGKFGGSIYNFAGSININDSSLNRSDAEGWGGVIYNDGGDVDISSSHFIENITSRGGAIGNSEGIVIIADSIFDGNHATYVAGAIDNVAGSIFISDSTFKNNKAMDQDSGAAIFNGYLLDIADTVFQDNEPLDIYASRDAIIKTRGEYSFTCATCEHKLIELPTRSS